ncbi:efflux RND transporter periplasmic adaptor subunit [Govanella unica]|uniref:Efflux RND transporter periplasmic adaptor subunit n=1 Tax=Govanella unica TaxID=2975056 RepID=A0A9X3TU55_9PROT|nr:efflux RND transporter periplasmic adaptor subunit [Govania unica]MDA5192411.1 efflux RND transporter periplasmic adaptor subunit [Govania unica]
MSIVRRHPVVATCIVVVALLVLAAGYRVVSNSGRSSHGPMQAPVITAPVSEVTFIDRIRGIGTAKANESVTITAKVTETVRSVNFEDGKVVKKGDVLVELTNGEEAASLAEAVANLQEAEKQHDRIADLAKRGNASNAALDTQLRQRNAARARVSGIEARMKDRLIRAPFDGVLGFRQVSPGTLVQPSTAVATLDDIHIIKLDFSVPEIYISALRSGLDISAKSDAYPGREFHGKVTTVDSRVDPATRAVAVRAEVNNPDQLLRPGMLIAVDVIRSSDKVLAVPDRALVPVQDRQYVFVVEGGKARAVQVEIGRRKPGAVELVTGPAVGTPVIVEGLVRVRDGVAVEVREQIEAFKSLVH